MTHPAAVAFDAAAASYDRTFTDTDLGRRYRQAVWRRLGCLLGPGDRVLELNCGTGVDAVHLAEAGVEVLATDVAPAMVATTGARVAAAGLAHRVEVRELAIEDLDGLLAAGDGPFDGVLSNFGGLNCVAELDPVARALAGLVRPGGVVVACVMGPVVPWEWGWFLAHRDPAAAFRRLRGPATWEGVTVHYPSVGALRRTFAPSFTLTRAAGLAALAPLPEAGAWAARHPRLVDRLDRWERRIEAAPGVARLADHALLEFRRTRLR